MFSEEKKRRGEISLNKMLSPNFKKKSYYMNFKHKNKSYMPYNSNNKFKVHVVWLVFFHKFGLNILNREISPGLLQTNS